MHVRMAAVLTLAVLGAAPGGPPGKARPLGFGPECNGLRIALSPSHLPRHPGELLHLWGYFWNVGEGDLAVPGHAAPWPAGELHLHRPNGDVFTFGRADARRAAPATYPVRRGTIANVRALRIRMTGGAEDWQPQAGTGPPPRSLSLREEGTYRVWFECSAPASGPAGAWSGTARSNVVTFTIRQLPPEKRRQEPTKQQFADLAKHVSHPDERQHCDHISRALLETENEGLATTIVQQLQAHQPEAGKSRPRWWWDLYRAVSARALPKLPPARVCIDGPYLRPLVVLSADLYERQLQPRRQPRTDGRASLDVILAYLQAHPEDKELHQRVVALAKKYAKVSELQPAERDPHHTVLRQAHRRLHFAWTVLRGLEVLRAGMSVEEAIEVLGPPTTRKDEYVRWYFSSDMHVNPYLDATVKDGKITGFSPTRR